MIYNYMYGFIIFIHYVLRRETQFELKILDSFSKYVYKFKIVYNVTTPYVTTPYKM